eukprot:TRINITY_DN14933_c0_g1_i1.p1 TRINITY_DN14933_c0_g1~~TRINITY_DN14933_c0_g1_i1.p1  ORF type:complete len:185 (-),score=24.97 TRINITY_DN14933_c0_g1_i1:49-603(-)
MGNIEWMHSLILFFHEILAKPDPDYFEFAWELLGQFVIKYPTTKALDLCNYFLENLSNNIIMISKSSNLYSLHKTLRDIQKAFPAISRQIKDAQSLILDRVNQEGCQLLHFEWASLKTSLLQSIKEIEKSLNIQNNNKNDQKNSFQQLQEDRKQEQPKKYQNQQLEQKKKLRQNSGESKKIIVI